MTLNDIKTINQDIYTLDIEITRNAKTIFIAALIFCSLNEDFRNPAKMTSVINFATSQNPISDIVDLAKKEIKKLKLQSVTYDAVCDSLDIIYGVSTKLYKDRVKLQAFVYDFIMNKLPSLAQSDYLFFETLYMEIDKKAKNSDKGITLTPYFAAKLMVELCDLDFKKDIVADLASGTGLFSLLAYSEMNAQIEKAKASKEISQDEYLEYKGKLLNSIVANDYEAKMVTLTLANFILKNLNTELIYKYDVLNVKKTDFFYADGNESVTLYPTKAILNPPYEDTYKPTEIILKTIELIKGNSDQGKVVVIIPPQKLGQKRDVFHKILNLARLDVIIKMQDDLFSESGQSPATSIFVFDLKREHKKTDVIRYFNFTDSGYVFLKDSGIVDKNHTHQSKKAHLLERISSTDEYVSPFVRGWTNFYDVSGDPELYSKIDPNLVKINKEEADVTFENATIKKMLSEKKKLITDAGGIYTDQDGKFEDYIIDILSED